MAFPKHYGFILNFEILSEEYRPENIPGRETQIMELIILLDSVAIR
jgi:Cdc6-like AAA superfamily ATPase